MTCKLLDIGCHIQSAAWEWWAEVGLLNKVLIVGGVVAIILALSWGFLSLLKRLGGWPAVGGAVAVVIGLVLAFLPRKPTEVVPGARASDKPKKPFTLGFGKKKPSQQRDPGGKRRYNSDTDMWEDVG